MRAHGLVGCHRRRRRGLARPDPTVTPAPDLVGRLFDPGAPDWTWFADISYIPTGQGWLYLAAGLICHSDSEYVEAGAPGLPDPHSDGRARMLVPGCSQAS
jgi:hypothetical protein